MSNIPEDIMQAAGDAYARSLVSSRGRLPIALAILAERQRCAELIRAVANALIEENPQSPSGDLLLFLGDVVLNPSKEGE